MNLPSVLRKEFVHKFSADGRVCLLQNSEPSDREGIGRFSTSCALKLKGIIRQNILQTFCLIKRKNLLDVKSKIVSCLSIFDIIRNLRVTSGRDRRHFYTLGFARTPHDLICSSYNEVFFSQEFICRGTSSVFSGG